MKTCGICETEEATVEVNGQMVCQSCAAFIVLGPEEDNNESD